MIPSPLTRELNLTFPLELRIASMSSVKSGMVRSFQNATKVKGMFRRLTVDLSEPTGKSVDGSMRGRAKRFRFGFQTQLHPPRMKTGNSREKR